MDVLVSIETIVLILVALLVVGLLRSHAEIIRAVQSYGRVLAEDAGEAYSHGLADTAGRAFDALGIAGETLEGKPADYPLWSTDDRDTVLAFLTTGCKTCQTFWDVLQSEELDLPPDTRLIIVAKDKRHESRSRLRRLAPTHHDLLLSSNAWTTYHVPSSPYFVFITGANAKVAGQGTAQSWQQVLDLLALTREEDELAAEEGLGAFADLSQPEVSEERPGVVLANHVGESA